MTIHLQKIAIPLLLVLIALMQFHISYAKEQAQPKLIKLRTIHLPYIASTPLLTAEEEGYFTEQGLQVEFIKMTEGVKGLPALIKGDLDVIPDTIYPSYLNAIARGANIKIVADRGYLSSTGCTYSAFMARRALVEQGRLNNISQMKGLRFASVQASSIAAYSFDKMLSKEGLPTVDVETVYIQMPARLDALERGSLDVAFCTEPWVTRVLQAGHAVIWKPIHHITPNFQLAFLMYGPTLLEKNPDAGRRFMIDYLKGVSQYNQGKTKRNLEIMAKHTGLDQELLQKCCWQAFRNDGRINADSILDFQSWALKKGFLDKVVPPDQFWDPSFIEYANKVLGESKK
jgi:NitT/TauT family transport system substrate-binding protein